MIGLNETVYYNEETQLQNKAGFLGVLVIEGGNPTTED
jgi:hypothetical protein